MEGSKFYITIWYNSISTFDHWKPTIPLLINVKSNVDENPILYTKFDQVNFQPIFYQCIFLITISSQFPIDFFSIPQISFNVIAATKTIHEWTISTDRRYIPVCVTVVTVWGTKTFRHWKVVINLLFVWSPDEQEFGVWMSFLNDQFMFHRKFTRQ